MSETITAPNGLKATIRDDGSIVLGPEWRADSGDVGIELGPDVQALIRAQREANIDLQLGRWRYPNNPMLLVYPPIVQPIPGVRSVRVFDERTCMVYDRHEKSGLNVDKDDPYLAAANAWFEAHPLPKPAWYDAQPGEIWVLTVDGREAVGRVDGAGDIEILGTEARGGGYIIRDRHGVDEFSWITAGERLYPRKETQ